MICIPIGRNCLGIYSTVALAVVGLLSIPFAAAAKQPQQSDDPDSPVRRLIILTSHTGAPTNPKVQALYSQYLLQLERKNRKSAFRLSVDPEQQKKQTTFTPPGKPVRRAVKLEEPTNTEICEYSELIVQYWMIQILSKKYRIQVVPDNSVIESINKLGLTRSSAESSEGAKRLCAAAHADAVVGISQPSLTIQERFTRDVLLRDEFNLAALRDSAGGFVPTPGKKAAPRQTSKSRPKDGFTFTAAAVEQSFRALLRTGFTTDRVTLAASCAKTIAATALHTLATGDTAPLMAEGDRIAIAPIPAPASADFLRYKPDGRTVQQGAVKNLPQDVSVYLHLNNLTVLSSGIVDTQTVEKQMKFLKIDVNQLWAESKAPSTETLVRLGKQLNVAYVLVASISDIEGASATDDVAKSVNPERPDALRRSATSDWQRKTHAEAVGALVRVSDGVIIWQERGEATIQSRQIVQEKERPSEERSLVLQAEKFAIIDLKRHLSDYFIQFQQ